MKNMKSKLLMRMTLRMIAKRKAAYISIIIILALALSVFIATAFGARRYRETYTRYVNENRVWDIKAASELLLTPEDIAAIKELPNVEEISGMYQVTSMVKGASGRRQAYIVSMTGGFNKITLTGGELPWQSDECLVEKSLADELGVEVGDDIYPENDGSLNVEAIYDEDRETSGFLRHPSYRISGFMEYPENTKISTHHTPYIVLPESGFDTDIMDGAYMCACVRVGGALEADRFSADYIARVDEAKDAIKEISDKRYSMRLDSLRKMYDEARKKYDRYFKEHKDAHERMMSLGEELEEKSDGDWIVNTITTNIGYHFTDETGKLIERQNPIYSNVFLFIGLVIMYITLSRMARESVPLIGDMRANGMRGAEVSLVFVMFGISSAAFGIMLGILIGGQMLERLVLYEFSRDYVYDALSPAFYIDTLAWIVILVFGLVFAAVFIAVKRYFRCPILSLMREDDLYTTARRRRAGGNYSLLTVVVRNLANDLPRVIAAVLSAAGTCLLMVLGGCIGTAVYTTSDFHREEILSYDFDVNIDTASAGAVAAAGRIVAGCGGEYICIANKRIMIRNERSAEMAVLRVMDIESLDGYMSLKSISDGKPVKDVDGIIISEGYSRALGAGAGDTVEIEDEKGKVYATTVGDVAEYYIGYDAVMTPKACQKIFAERVGNDTMMVRLNGANAKAVKESLLQQEGVRDVVSADERLDYYDSYLLAFSLVMYVLTGFAIAMAAVAVLNLTDMQIANKKKELMIMRINGFTIRELKVYLGLEALINSAAGTVIGLIAGSVTAPYVINSVGKAFASFITVPPVRVYMIPAAVMVVSFTVIYGIAFKSLSKIKLTA